MFISVGVTGLLTFLAFGSIISYVALVVLGLCFMYFIYARIDEQDATDVYVTIGMCIILCLGYLLHFLLYNENPMLYMGFKKLLAMSRKNPPF